MFKHTCTLCKFHDSDINMMPCRDCSDDEDLFEASNEYEEFQRLAEIGKAVEESIIHNFRWCSTNYVGGCSSPDWEDLEKLLKWHRTPVVDAE